MLVTSIFSFSNNVFKSFLFQRCLKSGLCGNGLKSNDRGKKEIVPCKPSSYSGGLIKTMLRKKKIIVTMVFKKEKKPPIYLAKGASC